MSVKAFFCYAHEDEDLLNKLKAHLKQDEREGLIDLWYGRDINAGTEWEREVDKHLNGAQLILLLVSPDFLASDHISSVEMKRALERYERGEAQVIPVILRPVYWQRVLGNFNALPKDGRPVTNWPNQDDAFLDVAEGIRRVIGERVRKDTLVNVLEPKGSNSQGSNDNRVSRRTVVIVGLAGLAVAGGSLTLLALAQRPHTSSSPSPPSFTPSPIHTSTSIPAGTTLFVCKGHSGQVYGVAWSPDGTRIASGSADRTVRVWNPSTGMQVVSNQDHSAVVEGVAWSPDSTRIASGSDDKTVQVWEANQNGKPLTDQNNAAVSSVAWSPDGTRIAFGGYDHNVKVWNAVSGGHVSTFRGHSDVVNSVTWSPDGRYIASASDDQTVRVWNASRGEQILIYQKHFAMVNSVAWSPDGTRIASGGYDNKVQVWDASTGKLFLTYSAHSDRLESVAWSPDGTRIASGSHDQTVQVWDASSGEHFLTYQGHSDVVNSVAWSPEGKRIVSGSDDQTVQIWQAV